MGGAKKATKASKGEQQAQNVISTLHSNMFNELPWNLWQKHYVLSYLSYKFVLAHLVWG